MATARAAVLVGRRKFELQEFETPRIGSDEALLQVEACGMCGTDVEQYDGMFEAQGVNYPFIPGHEPVGRIAEIGDAAALRWSVEVGDRVAVEPILGCGYCAACRQGRPGQCSTGRPGTGVNAYGNIPTSTRPGLWGGYATHLYLDPMASIHKVDDSLPIELAVLYQPVAAGIRWFAHDSQLKLGDTIVILGCGQRGLAGVIAAREAGAGMVIVTGLSSDAHKLELARTFGADATIVADQEDVVARVRELTADRGVDVAVDVSAVSMEPIAQAIEIVRPGGTVILVGMKGGNRTANTFIPDKVVAKELTLRGLVSQDARAFVPALRLIAARRYPLERMHTHTFGLGELDLAMDTLAGRVPGAKAIHVMIDPTR
jgi:threonine dehydrogenase-like Zn-dependent dehydrogenase